MFVKKKSLWLFLLPGLLGLMVFHLVPFIGGIYYSLTDGTVNNNLVWFQNYQRVWANAAFQQGLRNSLELSLLSTPLIFLFSFILAIMLKSLRERSLPYRNILLMPYLVPSSALLIIWMVLFDYGGIVNRLVTALGFERVMWLESGALRVPIILLYVWKNVGFSVVIFSAALQSVPDEFYEYAALEGAGPVRQARSITLPLIMPTAFLVFVLAWVNAFKIFKEVYFIGGAYPRDEVYTLQHFMNNRFAKLEYQDVTTAAYSFALIVMVFFAMIYMRKGVRGVDRH
ncbi:MAG: sugar ABC transporter permease [Clostridiales bacterium]|jgi:multiple sugar transport system permease protein|nr:sugar ABC transporter permease [Clostridiales bacterium]